MADLLLRGGWPWGLDGAADVLIRGGVIDQLGSGLDPGSADVFDVAGKLVLPGLVDAHCHLDKTLYGAPWEPHSAGDSLAERIANDRGRRGRAGPAEHREHGCPAGADGHLRDGTRAHPYRCGPRDRAARHRGRAGGYATVRRSGHCGAGRVSTARRAHQSGHGGADGGGTAERRRHDRRDRPGRDGRRPRTPSRRRVRARRALRRRGGHPPARRRHARRLGDRADRAAHQGDRTVGPGRDQPRVRPRATRRRAPGQDRRPARRRRRRAGDRRRLQLPRAFAEAGPCRRGDGGVRSRRHPRPMGPVRHRRHAGPRDASRVPQHVPP